ncbi:MAG TPA: DUF480 domain-containing protein [Acidimicrobiales bacterium]|nr:DUF480 domain-containing protein [Acidimicrobiales bacterium]
MELTAAEGRVLGCLIEQEAVAPGAVPLTLNALRLACNQSTGRDPVVAYDDRTVEDTLLALKSRGLARFVAPTPEVRTTRYRHRADERWRMGPGDLAVLAVLLLRGVQAVEDVRAQAQRLHRFADPYEVDAVLDALAARTPRPFAARVRAPGGGHGIRWVQVLTGPAPRHLDDEPAPEGRPAAVGDLVLTTGRPSGDRVVAEITSPSYADLVARVADLERRLAASLDRSAAALPPPPPPPPPVDVRARAAAQLGAGASGARHRDGRRSEPGALVSELADLVERIGDIERRVARIEAELGALR